LPKKPDYAKLVFNVPNVMYISYEELLELAYFEIACARIEKAVKDKNKELF